MLFFVLQINWRPIKQQQHQQAEYCDNYSNCRISFVSSSLHIVGTVGAEREKKKVALIAPDVNMCICLWMDVCLWLCMFTQPLIFVLIYCINVCVTTIVIPMFSF